MPSTENSRALIELKHITKTYPGERGPFSPLRDVNAQVIKKRLVVLMGPSGTGKSTLFRLLNRLEDPDEGVISYRGKPLKEWDPVRLRREVHYVYQSPILFLPTVEENLAYPLYLQDKELERPEMIRLLQRVGLSRSYLHRFVDDLSGGEKQRVHLARSFSLRPEILLLDEPTASLDEESTERIEKEVRDFCDRGGTVVWISHLRKQAERIADERWYLENGKLTREEKGE
ncbi:ABC transporter ATP-binding protein [Paludifilum halophilum]|nr:ATP-binding cassette domain-containing protein [Paludifilum halophilum]